jgi:hypothetical protein
MHVQAHREQLQLLAHQKLLNQADGKSYSYDACGNMIAFSREEGDGANLS